MSQQWGQGGVTSRVHLTFSAQVVLMLHRKLIKCNEWAAGFLRSRAICLNKCLEKLLYDILQAGRLNECCWLVQYGTDGHNQMAPFAVLLAYIFSSSLSDFPVTQQFEALFWLNLADQTRFPLKALLYLNFFQCEVSNGCPFNFPYADELPLFHIG